MNTLDAIVSKVLSGVYPDANDIILINQKALDLLNSTNVVENDLNELKDILKISDILYNNTDRSVLPLDDGIYDRLVEKYKLYRPFEVCAIPVQFQSNTQYTGNYNEDMVTPIIFLDPDLMETSLFINDDALLKQESFMYMPQYPIEQHGTISKINVNVPHKYPKLVGTLDKCKFTLIREAMDKGVNLDDPTVRIFERDFIGNHIEKGFLSPYEPFDLVCELKYDGISIEADVTNKIISARSRGDTDADLAADLTPIFGGMVFPRAPEYLANDEPFGMKFEAIITKPNLERLNQLRGVSYVNSRVAMIGLSGASDAYKYRNFITLIPIETSLDLDRETELVFINKYYSFEEINKYAIIRNAMYTDAIFQVYKFVQEAQMIRDIIPYMYDGVVVSYLDQHRRDMIGRTGAINKYSTAIKFEPLLRQTIFNGYTYSVGQNGVITPLLHYNPVEFYGSIHTKSSGHSYARFIELDLRPGDIINVEYTNDVMPYVTKTLCDANITNANQNPPIQFPTICPSCGTDLIFTDKSAICTNRNCPERVFNRATNMLKVLGIKDFSLERVKLLGIETLTDLISLDRDVCIKLLGDVNGAKLFNRIQSIFHTGNLKDYIAISSIGFENISNLTWKTIFSKLSFDLFIELAITNNLIRLYDDLVNIKGIGPKTAETIVESCKYPDVIDDLVQLKNLFLQNKIMITYSPDDKISRGIIRFSGVRNPDLELALSNAGYDCSGTAGVTKKTDILIVPYPGYQSSKVNKLRNGAIIMPIDEVYARLLGVV